MEILREQYLSKIEKFKDIDLIKIIVGIRRCGKTTILNQYRKLLATKYQIDPNHIIYMDFSEGTDLTPELLLKKINNKINDSDKHYVFLDEIQEVKNFEKTIISIYNNKLVDLYITGSNSHLLSKELATLFTGRDIEIEIFPFSFKEFKLFASHNGYRVNDVELFNLYIEYGGMPIISKFALEKDIQSISLILTNTNDSIIVRDIQKHHSIRNMNEFIRVSKFMYDNIGNSTSFVNLEKTFNAQQVKITFKTIKQYVNWLCDSKLLYNITKFDNRGKLHLKMSDKYYACDIGLRNAKFHFSKPDKGHMLENIIYFELLRRYSSVSVYEMRNGKEIDFSCIDNMNKRDYIQVSKTFIDNDNINEISNFDYVKKYASKLALSLDEKQYVDTNGVQYFNIIKWLLS